MLLRAGGIYVAISACASTCLRSPNTFPGHHMLCLQEYAYTMAAAYRSEQRRLLSFLRMADFVMCDTLQTILVQSMSDMLSALEPAPYAGGPQDQQLDADRPMQSSSGASSAFSSSSGGRSLQAMASILAGSRRARAAAAVAGMQLQPVTAGEQAASAKASVPFGTSTQAAASQRQPLLEMDVVMNSSCAELSFIPEPEDFQVWTSTQPTCLPASAWWLQ